MNYTENETTKLANAKCDTVNVDRIWQNDENLATILANAGRWRVKVDRIW